MTRRPTNQPLRRHWAILSMLCLCLLVLIGADHEGLRAPPLQRPSLSLPDVDAYIGDLAVDARPPTVLLSREDAVAAELFDNSRTMSEHEALAAAAAICDEAERAGYDPLLFVAVIYVESHFNHLALSPVGAEGLMQLMPNTAEYLADRGKLSWLHHQSFDPVINVRLGVRYLIALDQTFGGMDRALTAYNRGPHNTQLILRHAHKLPPAIFAFYAGKVLDQYDALVRAYGQLPSRR